MAIETRHGRLGKNRRDRLRHETLRFDRDAPTAIGKSPDSGSMFHTKARRRIRLADHLGYAERRLGHAEVRKIGQGVEYRLRFDIGVEVVGKEFSGSNQNSAESSPLSASSAASASVPEPFSLMLIATAALGGLITRRRRMRSGSPGNHQSKFLTKADD